MERPELTIKQILVTAEIPLQDKTLEWQTGDPSARQRRKASFYINTETWECEGQVAGHPVMADEEWWRDQCSRVANRVKTAITTLTV